LNYARRFNGWLRITDYG